MEGFFNELQQAVITVLALGAALGIGWFAVGKSIYASVFGDEGWFKRIDKRFEALETHQGTMASGLEDIRSEQKNLRVDLRSLAIEQQRHAVQIARLEGRDEARKEAAQLASAVGQVAQAMSNQAEESKDA